jgi:oxygen-independent coproporphyrinogen-3 oxidase
MVSKHVQPLRSQGAFAAPDPDPDPGGLYIHIPFCARVCPYCDFVVTTGGSEKQRRFVEHLLREVDLCAGEAWRFDTVYLGGGTPSHLPPEEIERIVGSVRSILELTGDVGLSLEVNPEDVQAERLSVWRSLGVDFISLGVQSFRPESLRFLGRRHSSTRAQHAVELALEAGFSTVSLDLIYGLPEQSVVEWKNDLEQAVALKPHHISCYQLAVHDATVFGRRKARGRLREATEEKQAELFDLTHRFLLDAGYEGYEVSNFAATPKHRSRHNRKYWNHTPYLGLGPAAHSFDGRSRWWNARRVGTWENELEAGRRPVEEREKLTREALMLEAVMLGLRTREGIDLFRFTHRFDLDLMRSNHETVRRWIEEGLVEESGHSLRPTIKGLAVADGLAASLDLE